MKKTYLLAIVLFAVFAMCGCNRVEVIDVQGEVIAVKKVNKESGFFSLPITSPDNSKLVWRARPISNWLHVNDEGWKQNAYNLFVNYDSNESSIYVRNFARVGYIVVETYDGFVADTVVVKQRGLTPYMALENVEVEASVTECQIEFSSNLTDDCRPNLVFDCDAAWVKSIEYLSNGTHLLVKLSANGGAAREATIKAIFTDAWGEDSNEAKCVLTQKALE